MNRCTFSVVFFLCVIPLHTLGQRVTSLVPYYRYNISAAVGFNDFNSDLVANSPIGPSASLRGAMFAIHGVEVNLEFQTGLLKADNGADDLENLRFAKNNYSLGMAGLRLYPLLFLQNDFDRRVEYRSSFGKKLINRFYLGPSFGVMYNKQLGVHDEYFYQSNLSPGPIPIQTKFTDRDRGFSYIGSLNTGFNIPLSSLNPNALDLFIWSLNINAQFNFGVSRGKDIIDGWSMNDDNDKFNVYSVGLNLAF